MLENILTHTQSLRSLTLVYSFARLPFHLVKSGFGSPISSDLAFTESTHVSQTCRAVQPMKLPSKARSVVSMCSLKWLVKLKDEMKGVYGNITWAELKCTGFEVPKEWNMLLECYLTFKKLSRTHVKPSPSLLSPLKVRPQRRPSAAQRQKALCNFWTLQTYKPLLHDCHSTSWNLVLALRSHRTWLSQNPLTSVKLVERSNRWSCRRRLDPSSACVLWNDWSNSKMKWKVYTAILLGQN